MFKGGVFEAWRNKLRCENLKIPSDLDPISLIENTSSWFTYKEEMCGASWRFLFCWVCSHFKLIPFDCVMLLELMLSEAHFERSELINNLCLPTRRSFLKVWGHVFLSCDEREIPVVFTCCPCVWLSPRTAISPPSFLLPSLLRSLAATWCLVSLSNVVFSLCCWGCLQTPGQK